MTWRSVAAVALVAGALALGSACGSFDREEARDLVNRVGAQRILEAADSLAGVGASGRRELPPDAWPAALRDLEPERIAVDGTGVEVSIRGSFVTGEGLYIVFREARPPTEGTGGDPEFQKIADRIYWVHYRG